MKDVDYMHAMKTFAFAGSLFLAAARPCPAVETPFAAPPMVDPGQPSSAVLSLSEIMGKVQMRHIKLWYAIKSRSWDLVSYELGHLRDTFETAVILYRNIPIELIAAADKPLGALQDGAKARDGAAAERSFTAITASCNACHEAAGIGFIRIRTPTSLPFSNQSFAPQKK
jgi:cytochrome c553